MERNPSIANIVTDMEKPAIAMLLNAPMWFTTAPPAMRPKKDAALIMVSLAHELAHIVETGRYKGPHHVESEGLIETQLVTVELNVKEWKVVTLDNHKLSNEM